jgi:hypothetical protein
MMIRARGKVERCSKADAKIRVDHARLYLTVAQTVLIAEPGEEATVATGNAVLAAIAAADAICCASAGSRFRGQDHAGAADYLEKVTGDKKLATTLRDVVNLKDLGHYGLGNVAAARAKSAIRKARQLVEEAERRVR